MKITSTSNDKCYEDGNTALLISKHIPTSLTGRLLQLIETMGLPETQEKATKDTIKNIVYDTFGHDSSSEFIDEMLYAVLLDIIWQERSYRSVNGVLENEGKKYSLTKELLTTK